MRVGLTCDGCGWDDEPVIEAPAEEPDMRASETSVISPAPSAVRGRRSWRRRLAAGCTAAVGVAIVAGALIFRHHALPSDRSATGTSPTCPKTAFSPGGGLADIKGPPFFDRPVSSITACRFAGPGGLGRLRLAVPLNPELSTNLAHALNNAAPASTNSLACLTVTGVDLLVARDIDGVMLPAIRLGGRCHEVQASNGKTVGYLSTDDPALQAAAAAVHDAQ
jgi:hypothetical protein